jgi:RNA polymerase sigma factor (sigma-70 family)
MMNDDTELLRRYSEARDEGAFRELVERHFGLVYSTALRMVGGDVHLAEDVSQTVFADLARKAYLVLAQLPAKGEVLDGWLYTGARFAAAKAVRGEQCRRGYEHEAQQMNEILNGQPTASELIWNQLRPVLDDAMGELSVADRNALLLRFFKGKTLREVGEQFGLGEDAARMRVSRALERLREILVQQGVTTTAGALAVAVSSNAIGAVPSGLVATIASASLAGAATATTSTTITMLKLMTITKLKIGAVSALMISAVAVPIWQETRLQQIAAENRQLQAQSAELQQERDEATNRLHLVQDAMGQSRWDAVELARLRGELPRLRNAGQELATLKAATASPIQAEARTLAATVETLKKLFEEMPEKKIPELQLLSTADWLEQTQTADLASEIGVRKSLGNIRNKAKNKFAHLLQDALKKFADANGGQLPSELSQVALYFKSPVDNEALARYQLTLTGSLKDVGGNFFVIEKAPVDDYDTLFEISLNGVSVQSVTPEARVVREALSAYASANNGQMPAKVDELRPYLKGPVNEATLQGMFRSR